MAVAVEDQNNSYDAWENYANLAYAAVASDTESLGYCSAENVVPDPTTAYRMDCGVAVLRYGNPCHHYRADKTVDCPTRMMTAATVGPVNAVMIYCCRCGD